LVGVCFIPQMPLPRSYLSQQLPKPLPTKDGTVLSTIGEASAYMVELPEQSAQNNCWQYAVKLILEQADPTRVGYQVELALFMDYRLDLSATG
jgi:hypothetical protein